MYTYKFTLTRMLVAKNTELKGKQQQTSPSKRKRTEDSPTQPNPDARNENSAPKPTFQRVCDGNAGETNSSPPKRVRLDSEETKTETTRLTHTDGVNDTVCFGSGMRW